MVLIALLEQRTQVLERATYFHLIRWSSQASFQQNVYILKCDNSLNIVRIISQHASDYQLALIITSGNLNSVALWPPTMVYFPQQAFYDWNNPVSCAFVGYSLSGSSWHQKWGEGMGSKQQSSSRMGLALYLGLI